MLNLQLLPIMIPQIRLQHPPKQLEQNLKARLCNSRVIPSLAELVADESVLRPCKLVEAEDYAGIAQLLADQVSSCVRHVGVFEAEDQGDFALELGEKVEGVRAGGGRGRGGVGGRVRAEGAAVDVGCKVGYAGCDARVKLGEVRFWLRGVWGRGHTLARRARWPPRHMPVVPTWPVHVGRLRRWSTVTRESAS